MKSMTLGRDTGNSEYEPEIQSQNATAKVSFGSEVPFLGTNFITKKGESNSPSTRNLVPTSIDVSRAMMSMIQIWWFTFEMSMRKNEIQVSDIIVVASSMSREPQGLRDRQNDLHSDTQKVFFGSEGLFSWWQMHIQNVNWTSQMMQREAPD